MTGIWLPGAKAHDMSASRGNGPFKTFLGVCLHDNESTGDLAPFITGGGGANEVCPNFEVYKDGTFDQYLPLDWQPWCQVDGNYNYAAIETEGYTTDALTPAAQATIAVILAAYRDHLGMAMTVTDTVGAKGFITHYAGGQAWGGHTCPGPIRGAQRAAIITAVTNPAPQPAPEDDEMKPVFFRVGDGPDIKQTWILWPSSGLYVPVMNQTEVVAYGSIGAVAAVGDASGYSITGAAHALYKGKEINK